MSPVRTASRVNRRLLSPSFSVDRDADRAGPCRDRYRPRGPERRPATGTPLPSSISALRGWSTASCWPGSHAPVLCASGDRAVYRCCR